MEKKNILKVGLTLVFSFVLGFVSFFKAIKLYRRGNEPVPPTAPRPVPAKTFQEPQSISEPNPNCILEFDIGVTETPTPTITGTITPTPTGSITVTPTPTGSITLTPTPTGVTLTPTSTHIPGCWDTCIQSTGCSGNLSCQYNNNTYRCVNPDCPTDSDCVCGFIGGVSPTPSPQLLDAGISFPTLGSVLLGSLIIIAGFVLIF